MPKPSITFLLAVLSLAGVLSAQSTWIVDNLGGGDFTDIPPAIAAAAPGDRIEVRRAGPYSPFVVDRGVAVDAVALASVVTIEVVGVPAAQSARVSGFLINQQAGVLQVSVRACAGAVTLVDIRTVGLPFTAVIARPGLEVVDSARVFVSGGEYVGRNGTQAGAEGARVSGSNVAFERAIFQGGVDIAGFPANGNDARAGILLVASRAILTGVTVRGGSPTSGLVTGGDGGAGVVAPGTSDALVVGQCTLVGQLGGASQGTPGVDGPAASGNVRVTQDCALTGLLVSGAVVIPNRAWLSGPASVAIGNEVRIDLHGAAQEFVLLGLDVAHDHVSLPGLLDGPFLLTVTWVPVAFLQLDVAGAASLAFCIPNAPVLAHLDLFAQPFTGLGTAPAAGGPLHIGTH